MIFIITQWMVMCLSSVLQILTITWSLGILLTILVAQVVRIFW